MIICTSGPCVCSAAVKRMLDMITRLRNNHTTPSSIYGSFMFPLVLTIPVCHEQTLQVFPCCVVDKVYF